MMDQRVYTSWVLVERDPDADEDLWVSHSLEFDVISQGRTPREAIESLHEAVAMIVVDDIEAGLDPLDRPKAPGTEWERLWTILKHGHAVKISEVAQGASLVLAAQIALTVECINHSLDVEMPVPLYDRTSFGAEMNAA